MLCTERFFAANFVEIFIQFLFLPSLHLFIKKVWWWERKIGKWNLTVGGCGWHSGSTHHWAGGTRIAPTIEILVRFLTFVFVAPKWSIVVIELWVVDNIAWLSWRPSGVLARAEFVGSERLFSSFNLSAICNWIGLSWIIYDR